MGVVIGLLGGVASGKSTVARLMAERGLIVIDADAEARAVVEESAVAARLAERFGADLFDGQGRLDRATRAARAFADEASTRDLNALVHPRVRERIGEALARARERPVVLDVPLLLESPLADLVTTWVFVAASEASREARARGRDWPAGERARREARQAELAAKRARAGHVLENDGPIEDLGPRVDALLAELGIPVAPSDARDPRS
jgi:dephospho-CoA kinase